MKPNLIVFSGLPGSGKSTIARLLAEQTHAVWLRIDTIEQALLRTGLSTVTIEGYAVADALAADLLMTGQSVIADSVNPIIETRKAWHDVAANAGVRHVAVGVFCSDKREHRRRIETRTADIAGHDLPTWADAVAREFQPFDDDVLLIDSSVQSPIEAVDLICARLI